MNLEEKMYDIHSKKNSTQMKNEIHVIYNTKIRF